MRRIVFVTAAVLALLSMTAPQGAALGPPAIKRLGWQSVDRVTGGNGYYDGSLTAKAVGVKMGRLWPGGPKAADITVQIRASFTGGVGNASLRPQPVEIAVRNVNASWCTEGHWRGNCMIGAQIALWSKVPDCASHGGDNSLIAFSTSGCTITIVLNTDGLPEKVRASTLRVFWRAYHSEKRTPLTRVN